VRLTPAVRAIFGLEIRTLLRDVRTVLISIVLPVVLIPALLLAMNWVEDRRVEREDTRVYRYAVVGTDSLFALNLMERIAGGPEDERDAGSRFRRVPIDAVERALEGDSVDVVLETFTASGWAAKVAEDPTATEVRPEFRDTRVIRLALRSNRTASREGASILRELLMDTREARRDSILIEAGFPVDPGEVAAVDTLNVATDDEVAGARLGRFLTLLLLTLVVLGGSVVATDSLAGEKERGTLATLLTTAATRSEIITGKLLAIMAVAFAIALVQVLNLWVYLGLGVIDAASGFQVTVTPEIAAGLLFLFLPIVALSSGVLLLTSARANSYKEAQLFLTPVLLGLIVPTLAPVLPGISLDSAIMFVPLANLSVAVRDMLVGELHMVSLGVSWVVTAAAAAWITGRSVRALHDEELMTGDTSRDEFLGGEGLFRKRVVRWFVVFWALKVMVDFNLQIEDLRIALLVSVGLVFLLFPLVVIRRFRLDPVQALALRQPRPLAWLGVLIGAPAGIFAANGVFRLMDRVIPMPTELIENFGQMLMPETIPVWQLVLFIAIIPGIAEELTFRGVLLHGLRRRFGPVGLALVVGVIFGFFHFQIFRIPATAFIGVVLTMVTLLTGSIFPAIVWHALNNGLAVYLASIEFDPGGELWWTFGGFVGLAVAFSIIWRYRTPYPDVGPPDRKRRERPPAPP